MFTLCSGTKSVDKPQESELELFAMDTYMSLKAYVENGETAHQKASDKTKDLEALLSVTSEESKVFRLNNSEKEQTNISPDTAFLIECSLNMNRETNGAFDITLYPITKEWGFTTGDYKVPSRARLDELLKNNGSDKIVFNKDDRSVSLKNGANIDLGGIAKGYAGSCCAEIIRACLISEICGFLSIIFLITRKKDAGILPCVLFF